MAENKKIITIRDNFGRRSGLDRRKISGLSISEARSGRDRRNGTDRRCGTERRIGIDRRDNGKLSFGNDRRSVSERRSGHDRRGFTFF